MRRFWLLVVAGALTLPLAACDKCGGFEDIRYPTPFHACKAGPSR